LGVKIVLFGYSLYDHFLDYAQGLLAFRYCILKYLFTPEKKSLENFRNKSVIYLIERGGRK
jgi:hypothetical protein